MFSTSKETQKDLQYQMKWTASVTNEDRRTTTLHWRLSNWMTTWLIQITYAVLFMFLWGFFVIHVYFAVHVCSFCFYLYLYFFSTVWISTRRNTLIASVLVTGKLFFVKSLFNVFKTNASDMHKKNDIQ